jgi:hypothetical protein
MNLPCLSTIIEDLRVWIKTSTGFKYYSYHNNIVKISVKDGWNAQSKLGLLGLAGSIAVIIVVFLID